MIRTVKALMLLLLSSLFMISCEKEKSEENGLLPGGGGSSSGTSVFTYIGAPGSCTAPVVSGTYTVGTALSSSNTIEIDVNVTTAGTYNITTSSANGISFSGSGVFATTGAQTITLQGTGTPATATTSAFVPGGNGCTFLITATQVVVGPVAAGTLNCAGATLAGVYTQGIDLVGSNTITISVNVTTAGSYSITSSIANGCSFSGSGTLALGNQNIVLTGSGTPINSGPVSFNVSLGSSNCSIPVTFLPGVPPPTDYLKCKIDGVTKTFYVNLDADDTPILLPFGVAVSGEAATGSPEYLDLTVNSISQIAAGVYLNPFGLSFSTSQYFDTNGDGWQPAGNSSPAFSVVVTSITATRIMGTFSGQYKSQNGTGTLSKQFTNGEFSVALP